MGGQIAQLPCWEKSLLTFEEGLRGSIESKSVVICV